jgi:hypothetical protein
VIIAKLHYQLPEEPPPPEDPPPPEKPPPELPELHEPPEPPDVTINPPILALPVVRRDLPAFSYQSVFLMISFAIGKQIRYVMSR